MVGIDIKNKNIVDTKFICSICTLIIRDPIQLTGCGHRLCQSCVDVQHGTTIECPDCLTEARREEVMIDQAFQREIQSLPIECSSCNWTGIMNNYRDHLDHCHPNPKCKHCDQHFASVKKLDEHQVLHCQKITDDCLLKDFGCDEQIVRCNIFDHYSSEQHQNSLLKASHQIQSQMENANMSSSRTDNDLLRSTAVMTVNPSVTLLEELCETLNNSLDDKKILSNDGQRRLNNALLQCQKKFPTLTLDFLRVKLSIQETNNLSK